LQGTGTGTATPIDIPLALKITGGALIPSVGAVIFNVVSYLVENFKNAAPPPLSETAAEIATGCTFAVIGVALGAKTFPLLIKIIFLFIGLVFAILLLEMAGPKIFGWNHMFMIIVIDIVALISLSWSIYATD
jgi:hypothetical protein